MLKINPNMPDPSAAPEMIIVTRGSLTHRGVEREPFPRFEVAVAPGAEGVERFSTLPRAVTGAEEEARAEDLVGSLEEERLAEEAE
jgi:hypothetical protein